jgi:hypothetical protein
VNTSSGRNHTIVLLENVFTVVYIIEFLLKIVSFGLATGPNSYLADPWNILDATVVGVGVADMLFPNPSTSAFVVLRAVRVLRPLRTLRFIPSLRIITNTLVLRVLATNLLIIVLVQHQKMRLKMSTASVVVRSKLTPNNNNYNLLLPAVLAVLAHPGGRRHGRAPERVRNMRNRAVGGAWLLARPLPSDSVPGAAAR